MKANNELAIRLPVQFKSVKKWKYVWKKLITKPGKIKQNDQKKKKKKFPTAGVCHRMPN